MKKVVFGSLLILILTPITPLVAAGKEKVLAIADHGIDAQKLCADYARLLTLDQSFRKSVDDFPMSEKHREQFHQISAEMPEPDSEIVVPTFRCSGAVLSIQSDRMIKLDLTEVSKNRVVVNGNLIVLSETRDLMDIFRSMRPDSNRKRPLKGAFFKIIFPSAYAGDWDTDEVRRGAKLVTLGPPDETMGAPKKPSGDYTVGWRIRLKKYRAYYRTPDVFAALVLVSAPKLIKNCRTLSGGAREQIAQNLKRGLRRTFAGCGGYPSGDILSYKTGFDSYNVVCKDGRVHEISWKVRDYRWLSTPLRTIKGKDLPGTLYRTKPVQSEKVHWAKLNFTYDDQTKSLAKIKKTSDLTDTCEAVISGGRVSKATVNPKFQTEAGNFWSDNRCFAWNIYAEIRGVEGKVEDWVPKLLGKQQPMDRDVIRGVARSDFPDDRVDDIERISPLANIPIAEACCADNQCIEDLRIMDIRNYGKPSGAVRATQ